MISVVFGITAIVEGAKGNAPSDSPFLISKKKKESANDIHCLIINVNRSLARNNLNGTIPNWIFQARHTRLYVLFKSFVRN